MTVKEMDSQQYSVTEKPYYLPIKDEVEIFRAAYLSKIPVILKGPTGTGKTRFVEYMAYNLGLELNRSIPLITVACHEDLTTTDLVGRYLLIGGETVWVDGPLTTAVKAGGICYLDEIVEARKDTTVIIHPLSDHRRILPLDKKGTVLTAHEDFFLVISYNPGYQSMVKDLKESTKQRFIAIDFDFPAREKESLIIRQESGATEEISDDLARFGEKIRRLKGHSLTEGASTRLLIYAGKLIEAGVAPRRACRAAATSLLSEEEDVQKAIDDVVYSIFP